MADIISVRNPYDFEKSNKGLDILNLTKKILETEYQDLDDEKKQEICQEICYKIQKKYGCPLIILENEYTEIIRRLIEKEISEISEPSRKYILTTACSALFTILAPIIIGTIISNTQPETPKNIPQDN